MDRAIGTNARNRMPTIKMGVHVDQGGPQMAARQIDPLGDFGAGACSKEARDPPLGNQHVKQQRPFCIDPCSERRAGYELRRNASPANR